MYLLSKYIERVYSIYGAWSVQYSKWRKVSFVSEGFVM